MQIDMKRIFGAKLAGGLVAISFAGLAPMQAGAAEELFSYADGPLQGAGAVGDWTGPWQPGPAAATGTPPVNAPFQVESNQLKIDFTDQSSYGYEDWDLERSLTTPVATPSVYVSFEITPGEMGSIVETNDDGYGWLNLGFSDNSSNMSSNGPMFTIYDFYSSSGGGNTFLQIATSLNGIYDGNAITVTNWTPGVTYQLVGRLDFDAVGADEQWTVWLDPADESSIPQVVTTKDLGYNSIGFTQMWYAVYNYENTQDTYADNLRIGSTWQSVIPEPSSLALLALGGLLVGRRRR